MAVVGYLRLLTGSARVIGAQYQQAPIPGDWWFEVFGPLNRLGGEVPLASTPSLAVRPAAPDMVGGFTGSTPIAVVTQGATGGVLDFSSPANSGLQPAL